MTAVAIIVCALSSAVAAFDVVEQTLRGACVVRFANFDLISQPGAVAVSRFSLQPIKNDLNAR